MVAAPPDRWQPTLDALGVACPGEKGWIHGGNTRTALSAALSDRRVQYIEDDISLVREPNHHGATRRSRRATWHLKLGWT